MYILLIIAAGFFYAVHERLDNAFENSVFRNLPPNFWNGKISSSAAKKILGSYPIDGRHLASLLMFLSMLFAVVLAKYPFWAWQVQLLSWQWQLVVCLMAFLITFDVSYNHLLYKKPVA